MTEVLETQGLTKHFAVAAPLHRQLLRPLRDHNVIRALDDVSLCIESGEILGLIGPNGAGKTTLMRVLADVMEPDAGSVRIAGQRMARGRHDLRRQIGYVSSDERSFFWRLTGRQNLSFFASLYGVSQVNARRRIGDILDLFKLCDKAEHPFRDYSSGTRKKFALARALIHTPRVILLDEITNSLDPPSAESVKRLVREYVSAREGRVGLWSTHRHEEIGEICDRVIAMDNGRVTSCDPTSDALRDAHACSPLRGPNAVGVRTEWQDAI